VKIVARKKIQVYKNKNIFFIHVFIGFNWVGARRGWKCPCSIFLTKSRFMGNGLKLFSTSELLEMSTGFKARKNDFNFCIFRNDPLQKNLKSRFVSIRVYPTFRPFYIIPLPLTSELESISQNDERTMKNRPECILTDNLHIRYFRKIAKSVYLLRHVCLSVLMKHLSYHWVNFRAILYLSIFKKNLSRKFKFY